MTDLATHYLEEARRQLRGHKRLAESAMSQLHDEDFFVTLDPESNSIAILIKHLAGNMRSRFTDFLTSDGEKPDRFRDREFEITPRRPAPKLCAGGRKDGLASSRRSIRYKQKTLCARLRFAASPIPCCKPSTGRLRTTPSTPGRSFFWRNIFDRASGRRSVFHAENRKNSKPSHRRCPSRPPKPNTPLSLAVRTSIGGWC